MGRAMPTIKVTKEEFKKLIQERIDHIQTKEDHFSRDGGNVYQEWDDLHADIKSWRKYNVNLLQKLFTTNEESEEYDSIANGAFLMAMAGMDDWEEIEGYLSEVKQEKQHLKALIDRVGLFDLDSGVTQTVIDSEKQLTGTQAILDITEKALKRIDLIDGYIDRHTLNLLEPKLKGVNIRVITKKRSLNGKLESVAKAFKKQHGHLEIKSCEDIHDRYLIVDDEVYMVGASLKDIGGKATTIVKITEDAIGKAINELFESRWTSSEEFSF